MPVPPRDFSEFHASLGVRADTARVSPMAKFAPPLALLRLQILRDSGNSLMLLLDDPSWMLLACLEEPAAHYAITHATPYGLTGNHKLVSSTFRSLAAPFLTPVLVPAPGMVPSMPPVMPSVAPSVVSSVVSSVAPKFVQPPPPPRTPRTPVNSPKVSNEPLRGKSVVDAIRGAIAASNGAVTMDLFKPHVPLMNAMGPALAAKAVHEFARTEGWQIAPAAVLAGVMRKYI